MLHKSAQLINVFPLAGDFHLMLPAEEKIPHVTRRKNPNVTRRKKYLMLPGPTVVDSFPS